MRFRAAGSARVLRQDEGEVDFVDCCLALGTYQVHSGSDFFSRVYSCLFCSCYTTSPIKHAAGRVLKRLPFPPIQFRYFMDGSSTPLCASASFTTKMPPASLTAPIEAVTCGDASKIHYSIMLDRPHSQMDWIGIYPMQSYGPKGCVGRLSVSQALKIPLPHAAGFLLIRHCTVNSHVVHYSRGRCAIC